MKAELKKGSINHIIQDTDIYEAGEFLDSIAMVVKGRIRVHGYGLNLVVGSGWLSGNPGSQQRGAWCDVYGTDQCGNLCISIIRSDE